MNPNTEVLLSRLQKVQGKTGNWKACCPAHQDRSPSMTIRETSDGKLLLHCFAGCSVEEIITAVDMELGDLFPDKIDPVMPSKPHKPRFRASDLMDVIAFETTIIVLCANEIASGRSLSEPDMARVKLAAGRIVEAREAAYV